MHTLSGFITARLEISYYYEVSKPWSGCGGCNCDGCNWGSCSSLVPTCGIDLDCISPWYLCPCEDTWCRTGSSVVATDLPLIKFGRIISSTTWPWLVAYRHWQKTVSSLSGRFSSMFSSSLTLLFDVECDCINKTTELSSQRILILTHSG